MKRAKITELENKVEKLKEIIDMIDVADKPIVCARRLCVETFEQNDSEKHEEQLKKHGWKCCSSCCSGWVCPSCMALGYNTTSKCLAEGPDTEEIAEKLLKGACDN